MIVPVFPVFARSFGVGLAAIGLVQMVFGLTRFSFGLVGGLVVDRFGDRTCTMAGLMIVCISSYAVGFSQNFTQFVLARGFGGAGSALFIAGLMNRILRIIEPEAMGRATGAFRTSFLIGIASGPLLGGAISEWLGLRAPFHIYATGLILATVIAYVVMRGEARDIETEKKKPLEALRAAKPLFGDVRYVVALLATFVGWWTISGPTQVIGVVYAREELLLSGFHVAMALTMLALGEIAVLYVVGKAADTFGRRAVLAPSLAVVAIATALLGQIQELSWAFFPLTLVIGAGIAAGSTASGGLLADSIPKGGSGTAVGVNQMAGDLGYLLSPTAVGALAEGTSYQTAYFAAAVPAAVVFFASLRLPKRRTTGPAELQAEPSAPG